MKAIGFQDPLASPLQAWPSDPQIRTQVAHLLDGLVSQEHWPERRQEQRYPFPYLVQLTRLAADGLSPTDQSIVVVGKHISAVGFGFYHFHPLADRRMIASFETASGQWIAFLLDIRWCRFTEHGWYESGGRFLRAVPCPLHRPE